MLGAKSKAVKATAMVMGLDHERGKDVDAGKDNLSNAGLPLFACSRKMPAPIGTAG